MKLKKLVYLLSLWPVANAALFILMMSIDVDKGFFIRPIFNVSLVGLLITAAALFMTGYVGFLFAKADVKMWKAVVFGNALPIVTTMTHTVFIMCGKESSDAAVIIGELGNGMFSTLSIYASALIGTKIEVIASFALLIVTFAVGYLFAGISKK